MTFLGRISVLLLALVPVVWGLCPCAAAGSRCCLAVVHAPTPVAPDDCCPCCQEEKPQKRLPSRDAPAPKPCDGCPLLDAAKGVMPVDAVPPLPPSAANGDAPALPALPAPRPAAPLQIGDARPLGPPLGDLLASVVLLI